VVAEVAVAAPAPSGNEDSSSSSATTLFTPPPPPTYAEVLIRGGLSQEKVTVVIAEVTVPAADVTVAAAEVTVPAAEVTVAAAEVTVAASEVTVADVPAAEHSVAAVPGAEVEAAAAQIPAQVDSDGSHEFHYTSGRTPEKQGPYINADLPDQREYLGRNLDQMRFNSPGNNQYIGEILYSPGKRKFMSTPHPDFKSVTFRKPVHQHAFNVLNNALSHAHDDDDATNKS
jgi:hypothetical protein